MPLVKKQTTQWVDEETGSMFAEEMAEGTIYIAGKVCRSSDLENLFKSLPVLIAHVKDREEVNARQQAIINARIAKETGI